MQKKSTYQQIEVVNRFTNASAAKTEVATLMSQKGYSREQKAIVLCYASEIKNNQLLWKDWYNQEGDTLMTVSGGNHSGLMTVTQQNGAFTITSFDQTVDGAGNDRLRSNQRNGTDVSLPVSATQRRRRFRQNSAGNEAAVETKLGAESGREFDYRRKRVWSVAVGRICPL